MINYSLMLHNPSGAYFAENTPAMLALESMVDATSVANVLYALARICNEKADHLAANWQDDGTAAKWAEFALRLDKIAASKLLR
jgi:hypothetical protein